MTFCYFKAKMEMNFKSNQRIGLVIIFELKEPYFSIKLVVIPNALAHFVCREKKNGVTVLLYDQWQCG